MTISTLRWVRKPLIALAMAAALQSAWAGPVEDYNTGYDLYFKKSDVVGAMAILRKSADAGYAPAQSLLASILDYTDFDDEAIAYYRKAADQGDVAGQFGLATMLAGGEGAPKNLVEARRLFTLAAEQGHKQAINLMAEAYISGGLDIPENERQGADALRWIKLSAENGHIPAINALIKAYREGGLGLPVDVATANEWQAKSYEIQGLDKKGRRQPKNKGREK